MTLERVLVGRDRRREDQVGPFGGIRGGAAKVASHDGTKLHVEELGPGSCLVFAHGFSLTQDAWHYQRRPASQFRCVFYDQRGHGRSGRRQGLDYFRRPWPATSRRCSTGPGGRVVVVTHSRWAASPPSSSPSSSPRSWATRGRAKSWSSTYVDTVRGMTAAVSAWGSAWAQRTLITGAFRFMGGPVRAAARRRGSDLGYLGTRLFGFGSTSPSQVANRPDPGSTDVEVWSQGLPQPGRLRPVGVAGGGQRYLPFAR